MRLRYRSVSYTAWRTPASLERHYRELRDAMLRGGQHYGLQPAEPWRPPIDIHETPDAIQIKIELAGVREEDLDVTLYENALVVSGHRRNDVDPDDFVYYHEAQVRYGPFRADVLLPCSIEREAVAATYEQGFLRVRLPKAQAVSAQGRDERGRTENTESTGSRQSGGAGDPRAGQLDAVPAGVETDATQGLARGDRDPVSSSDVTATRNAAYSRAN